MPIDKIKIVWYDTIMKTEAFTKTEYQGFQQAYDFFNRELFDRSLPQVLVTLQRHAKSRGYFSPERFNGRIDETAVHELALNPDAFTGRTDEMILSTLAHEMAHVWQQTHGKPPRRSYHDRQWAAKMREIGLQPSSTGESLHYPRRPLRASICQASSARLSAPLAIRPGKRGSPREKGQQDEVFLPQLWTERMGKAGRSVDLRSVLRRRSRGCLHHVSPAALAW